MRLLISLGTLLACLLAGFALILGAAFGRRRPFLRIQKTNTRRRDRLAHA